MNESYQNNLSGSRPELGVSLQKTPNFCQQLNLLLGKQVKVNVRHRTTLYCHVLAPICIMLWLMWAEYISSVVGDLNKPEPPVIPL